jgi:hypothetical protein
VWVIICVACYLASIYSGGRGIEGRTVAFSAQALLSGSLVIWLAIAAIA